MEVNLKKSIVLDVAGRKVGVIGYLTPETKVLAVPNDVDYIEEVVALREEVKKLENFGITIIIALGHSGFQKDFEIAKQVKGLDLVIGGHSNTFLWNGTSPDTELVQGYYPTYVTQASGKQVPVVQAYAYTKYLGKLHVVFDSSGEIIKTYGNPIVLDKNVPQDSEVLKIVDSYRSKVQNFTEIVVGNTSVVLDGLGCQLHECNLGNLITDAMIYFYASHYRGDHWTDAPIAIIQGGAIRSSIAHSVISANITKGDLLSVMPFDGNLLTVTMNGSVLLQALEHAVAEYSLIDTPGEYLQFSGLRVAYDLTRPSGSRVTKAEARCWACNIPVYSTVKQNEVYNILMSSFLYGGGNSYWMFKNLPSQVLEYNELTCTEYYIGHRSPIYPQVEGRSTLITTKADTDSSSVPSLSLVIGLISVICAIIA